MHDSLVILRDTSNDNGDRGLEGTVEARGGEASNMTNMQKFLPSTVLYGSLPGALFSLYSFWQNADDSITGYMNSEAAKTQARTQLRIKLISRGPPETDPESGGFGNSIGDALISRCYIKDIEENVNGVGDEELSMAAQARGNSDPAAAAKARLNNSAAFKKKDNKASKAMYNSEVDGSMQVMYLLSVMSILNKHNPKYNTATEPAGPVPKNTELVTFSGEEQSLHALMRLMLRLDTLSNILAWSYTQPDAGADVSVDVIELPRLHLTFEKKKGIDGKVKYFCIEQSGMFIADYSDAVKFADLIDGLPNCILLENSFKEYYVLQPATSKPQLVKHKGVKQSFRLVHVPGDKTWLSGVGLTFSTYFVYPVHASGTFFSSKSISSSLYLLILNLMTHNYKDAFRLIDSCVCDGNLTAQEKQLWEIIATLEDDLLVDARACRLKLYFVTYGCQATMPFETNFASDMKFYVEGFELVSKYCRLSIEEEIFILSSIPGSSDFRTIAMNNREKLIRASFDLTFEKFTPKLPTKSFSAMYPKILEPRSRYEPVDFDLIDNGGKNFKSLISKLAFVSYKRPDGISGPAAITFLSECLDSDKNLGFFYMYELLGGKLPISIIPDEPSHSAGSVLLKLCPANHLDGVQGVVLRVMAEHQSLAKTMPVFEDNRRLKLPTIAGLDIFQSHIKKAAEFVKANMNDLNISRLQHNIPKPYKPSVIVQGGVTIDESAGMSMSRFIGGGFIEL